MAHVKILGSFIRLSKYGNVFWERLYKKLMIKQPDTLVYFSKTDMHGLYRMLSKSVTYVVLSSSNNSLKCSSYFNRIVDLHNKQLNIPQEYVNDWRGSLIETIQELDSELTDEELLIWTQTIDRMIEPIGV